MSSIPRFILIVLLDLHEVSRARPVRLLGRSRNDRFCFRAMATTRA